MADKIVPEVNRRQAENGVVAHVVETLIGKQSRKVAFGIWGFIAANALLTSGKIDIPTYWKMFMTCALLVGFGTVLDDVLLKFGDKVAGIAATKVNTLIQTETTKIEETTSVPVPPAAPQP